MSKTSTGGVPPTTGYSELDLSGTFALTSPARNLRLPIELPGD